MKIVVVSDSHGNKSRLDEIVLANQDADLYWHLGDYELPEYLMSPFMLIKGNCDFFSDSPISKDLIINDVKFHLEHGNKINFSNFEEYVLNTNSDVFLFGHLHKKINIKIRNTLIINPGSISKPRDDNKFSYVVINFKDINDLTVTFCYL